jgi:hypothetical protein
MYEVKGNEIQDYFSFHNLMAIAFWRDHTHFGLKSDWRKLTVQQKKLIMLYDELKDKEVNRGSH